MIDIDPLPVPIVQGPGSLAEIGRIAQEADGRRALIVTDKGIVKAGHVDAARAALEKEGLAVAVFDKVHENPTTRDVDACVALAKKHQPDILIGLGGGSSMDCAKGCNFIYTNGGKIQDYWGLEKATEPMLPFIAVPTTAGTGSECQRFALISHHKTHQKMACGDIKALAWAAILDPELTLTQPSFVTACTGMDAVAHAVETAVTRKRTVESLEYSRDAFSQLNENLETVIGDPKNMDARAAVQVGAALAGAAIEHSMLGAAHAAANPLTAHFKVPHGQAVGLMLPHVVRFNAQSKNINHVYQAVLGLSGEALAHRLEALLALTRLAIRLKKFRIKAKHLPRLSEEAAGQWTAKFNPCEVDPSHFESFYQAAL